MSLLGYFWLFNTLNILDGLLTIMGIEARVLYEINPVVRYFIEVFGLYWGVSLAKVGAFFAGLLLYYFKSRRALIILTMLYALLFLWHAQIFMRL